MYVTATHPGGTDEFRADPQSELVNGPGTPDAESGKIQAGRSSQ
jgi:hypothetical protein